MAGALKKTMVYLGLAEDELGYDEYDEYDDQDVAPRDSREPRAAVTPMPQRPHLSRVSSGGELSRITTIHPRTYNEAKTIGEHFREGVPVIMNLTDMEDADAKRLVDFAAGLIFCCRGSIERITTKVFLVCPPNVTLAAEEKEKIAADGFYNQS
jgi:cell division inhibitor SepF